MSSKLPKIFILISIALAVALYSYDFKSIEESKNNDYYIKFIKQKYKDAHYLRESSNELLKIFNKSGKKLGYCLPTPPYSDAVSGYASTVPALIVLNKKMRIQGVVLLKNDETPEFVESVIESGFLNSWNGLTIKQAINKEVDAVSGATYTSEAIIDGLELRLAEYNNQKIESRKTRIRAIKRNLLSAVVLIMALLSFYFPSRFKRYRIVLLISSVLILGFWLGASISLDLFKNWVTFGIPVKTRATLSLIVIISLLIPLFTNRSFYCAYVCPYGACQELAGKVRSKKVRLHRKVKSFLKSLKWIFFYTIVFLLLINTAIPISNFEPFSAFIFSNASYISISIALVFLILSIFFNKPWCTHFCPTGIIFEFFRKKERPKAINTQGYLIAIFLIVIIILIVRLKRNPASTDANTNQTIQTIFNRKSVRAFTDKLVPQQTIETLVKAGMAAPTGLNKQPWEFIAITDRAIISKLAENHHNGEILNQASALIVVCGLKDEHDDHNMWVMDCSAATENILLAAESLGLGAVWTSCYPIEQIMNNTIELLELPDNTIPLNIIPVGYPNGNPKPKDKWRPQKLHYNKWSN